MRRLLSIAVIRALREAPATRFVASALSLLLGEPRLRDAFLRPREPRLGHEIVQFVAIATRELRNPYENRRIVLEVSCREVDPAFVREHELLHVEIRDAEHQHVIEALAGFRI